MLQRRAPYGIAITDFAKLHRVKHDNEMQPGPPDGTSSTPSRPSDKIEEGRDYYIEGGFLVFTSEYLLGRGYCCGNGCRHCPYSSEEE